MNDLEILRRRLDRARARRDEGAPSSPDWAAAMEEIDELTARLARIAVLARAEQRVAVSS